MAGIFAVIRQVEGECQAHLFQIVEAFGLLGLGLGLGKSREQHAGENRNNGDDDQQFNQCEGLARGLT